MIHDQGLFQKLEGGNSDVGRSKVPGGGLVNRGRAEEITSLKASVKKLSS